MFSITSSSSISVAPPKDCSPGISSQTNLTPSNTDELFSSSKFEVTQKTHRDDLDDQAGTVQIFSLSDEDPPSILEESSIFCINCMESVNRSLINTHSVYCVMPIESIEEIKGKLERFLYLIRDFKLNCRDVYLYPLIIIENITKKVIESKRDLAIYLEKTNKAVLEFKDFPTILSALQKLSCLIETLIRIKLPICQFNLIDEQTSPLSPIMSPKSETSLNSSVVMNDSQSKEKLFYSKFTKIKRETKRSSRVSMFELFEICEKSNIPIDQWHAFIENNFNS